MGVIIGQMKKRRGASGAGYSKRGDLIINISVDVKMGKLLSAAWASCWVDGIDRFPLGGSVGFLMDTERRTLRGIAAHSHVKLAAGPLELANRCNSQPMLHHLTAFYIIRQTAQQTTHSHRSTPDHINYLSHSSPQPSRSLQLAGIHCIYLKYYKSLSSANQQLAFSDPLCRMLFYCPIPKVVDSKKVDECNEIQNLRVAQGAEVQQFVTISDRMSWPLQLKQ